MAARAADDDLRVLLRAGDGDVADETQSLERIGHVVDVHRLGAVFIAGLVLGRAPEAVAVRERKTPRVGFGRLAGVSAALDALSAESLIDRASTSRPAQQDFGRWPDRHRSGRVRRHGLGRRPRDARAHAGCRHHADAAATTTPTVVATATSPRPHRPSTPR